MTKRLKDIENDECMLEVYQCSCGYHMGVDYTYLEYVAENGVIAIPCPSCGERIVTDSDPE
jgi:hypothetical protein